VEAHASVFALPSSLKKEIGDNMPAFYS